MHDGQIVVAIVDDVPGHPHSVRLCPQQEQAQGTVGAGVGGDGTVHDDPVVHIAQRLTSDVHEVEHLVLFLQDALGAVIQVAVILRVDKIIAGVLQKPRHVLIGRLRMLQQGEHEVGDGVVIPPTLVLQGVGGGVVLQGDSIVVMEGLCQAILGVFQLEPQQKVRQGVLMECLIEGPSFQDGTLEEIGVEVELQPVGGQVQTLHRIRFLGL